MLPLDGRNIISQFGICTVFGEWQPPALHFMLGLFLYLLKSPHITEILLLDYEIEILEGFVLGNPVKVGHGENE